MGDETFSILTFEDLWLGYLPGEYLLKQASGEVRSGEMIALAGRNGTGKSTLLRTISGIRKPVRGSVTLKQRPLYSFPAHELSKNISFVATGTSLVENLTVLEMVSMGRHPYTNWWGKIRAKDLRKIHESIRFVGMEEFSDARVHRLSDGERQRVMIAMALAQDTRIMILDEPTAFLDIPNRIGILEVLNKLKSSGRTVIFSTHEFDNIFTYADKVWVIHNRELLSGAPEDLGMKGAYEHIFSDSGVAFDRDNLRFLREGRYDRCVELEGGNGMLRYWTRRALERGGYCVREQKEASENSQPDPGRQSQPAHGKQAMSEPGKQSQPARGKQAMSEPGKQSQPDHSKQTQGATTGNSQKAQEAIRVTIVSTKDFSSWNASTATATRTFRTLYDLMDFLTHID